MDSRLIQRFTDDHSVKRLKSVYDLGLIAAEKKPFLVDLKKSVGPYLAVADCDDYIFDACSQIATLGLGFNASPQFAACHHLESWTGDYRTENICAIASAYRSLLARQLGFDNYDVHFCSSGAEAVEIGLGLCFENRVNKAARRVLAFEGSFHGRMMVALSATFNPKKRTPFAWPGFESEFVPYPVANDAQDINAAEESSLAAVEEQLASGEFFAVLIEPMQCEGGDRYSSAPFHNRLIRLTRRYGVPLVYDEVQTGFHLGDTFFWHRQFDLQDEDGRPLAPDVVCCAKKSQVGLVMTHFDIPYWQSFCPASLIRGYAGASVLIQFSDRIAEIGETNLQRAQQLADKYPDMIGNPRGQGLCFAFDCVDAEILNQFVGRRFQHGLLFYSAGQTTARFRCNLAFKPDVLDLLWQQIESCLIDQQVAETQPININSDKVTGDYEFHSQLVRSKAERQPPGRDDDKEFLVAAVDYLSQQINKLGIEGAAVHIVDASNYSEFRGRVLEFQERVYEPIRQTPPEEFDQLFSENNADGSIAMVVTLQSEMIAMAFCGRLGLFAAERGVTDDPFFNDAQTCYMVDLTVAEKYRGGLGRSLKNAIAMLAAASGITGIHGRNRDRLARGMWAINLSLGSYQTQHLPDDYKDDNEFRDCIYYRMPLRWDETEPDVAFNTIDSKQLTTAFIDRNMPAMVNKVCLSNFVTTEFLDDLQCVAEVMPEPLRHLYTASSLSECVDKICKALWLHRKPATHLLTIEGHYFGEGSFLARSLSGTGEAYFPTTRIRHADVQHALAEQLQKHQPIAFFVQAEQFAGHEDYLAQCVKICNEAAVPIVFNETGPRYGTSQQISRQTGCQPDASVVWLGGQMALACTTTDYFADDPLMLISTWDGDAYSLARFAQFIRTQHD